MEAMASTTALIAPSATSPKMVWRFWRCGVGPTVMKNCEPLVPGPVRHRQLVRLGEGLGPGELVLELVAGATGA
ncbi:MAG: hypothetical protein R2702_01465 [Acidimicrobiales bacterium]